MVFVTKYRKSIIDNDIFEYLKSVFGGISDRYYLNFQAIGTDCDHLHILVESAPRYSPSKVMQIYNLIFTDAQFCLSKSGLSQNGHDRLYYKCQI